MQTTTRIQAHTDDVNAVCYGEDSPNIIVTGSDDALIKVRVLLRCLAVTISSMRFLLQIALAYLKWLSKSVQLMFAFENEIFDGRGSLCGQAQQVVKSAEWSCCTTICLPCY